MFDANTVACLSPLLFGLAVLAGAGVLRWIAGGVPSPPFWRSVSRWAKALTYLGIVMTLTGAAWAGFYYYLLVQAFSGE